MFLVKVHNLVTDQRYEFQAADGAEIDARLERKVKVYGRKAWQETVLVPDISGGPEPVEQIIDHPAEHEIVITLIDRTPELLAAAWAAADSLALSGADHNSRARYLAWLVDPSASQEKRDRIQAVMAWMDGIWAAYAAYRANPVGEFVLAVPACPYSFWDIAGA